MKYSIHLESGGHGNFAPDGATLLVDYINVENCIVTICMEDIDEQCQALLWCIQNGLTWIRNDDGVYVQFSIARLKLVELYQAEE
jgi:hypothetical protein